MNKIINRINMRNIQELYPIRSITENGQINLKDKFVVIYKVDPLNIVACDEETKHKIYQAYTTCIRGLPGTVQLIVSRDKADFYEQINMYKNRIRQIDNDKLKFAIGKYVEYLEEISNVNKLYKTSHYLIVESTKQHESDEILNVFSNLKEFGLRISQVNSKEKVISILKKYMVKE